MCLELSVHETKINLFGEILGEEDPQTVIGIENFGGHSVFEGEKPRGHL